MYFHNYGQNMSGVWQDIERGVRAAIPSLVTTALVNQVSKNPATNEALQTANTLATSSDWIKTNWPILAIGGGGLLLLILTMKR